MQQRPWCKKILHTLLYQVFANALSRISGFFATRTRPVWLVQAFIRLYFLRFLNVNMNEALTPELSAYPSVAAFFTRALKPALRPFPKDPQNIAAPCDGNILQNHTLENNKTYLLKGQHYSLHALLGNNPSADCQAFIGGSYSLIYLSPRDCHRLYAPVSAKLISAEYIAGALYPVKEQFLGSSLDVFARNRKLRISFSIHNNPFVMLWVGAFNVGSFQTNFDPAFFQHAAPVNPAAHKCSTQTARHLRRCYNAVSITRGDQLGAFELGSSVLLFFAKQLNAKLTPLNSQTPIRIGEALGRFTRTA